MTLEETLSKLELYGVVNLSSWPPQRQGCKWKCTIGGLAPTGNGNSPLEAAQDALQWCRRVKPNPKDVQFVTVTGPAPGPNANGDEFSFDQITAAYYGIELDSEDSVRGSVKNAILANLRGTMTGRLPTDRPNEAAKPRFVEHSSSVTVPADRTGMPCQIRRGTCIVHGNAAGQCEDDND